MLVGFADPGGVGVEGEAGVGVAESAGDGADVDSGEDEFGGAEVAQFVQCGADAKPGDEPVVTLPERGRDEAA